MRTYIEPTVKLIGSDASYYAFFIWMKSRQWIITDFNNDRFMVDGFLSNYSSSWYDQLPEKFNVGDEVVEKFSYYERIDRMNLQYNTCETYSFEINGSCLFRDILFNINRVNEWSQSNRFLFSILDKDAMYDESNYHISAEYKGIREWERQFDRYMDAIKKDPIVDHNRKEMPYSISSTFWITVDRKTLIDIIGFLHNFVPFFYNVYGKQFVDILGLTEDEVNIHYIPSSIHQYLHQGNWKEGVTHIKGFDIVDTNMGLILYSQFIRQKDVIISGLFDEIIGQSPIDFSHKVFKGGTPLQVTCMATHERLLSTVRTRVCAFAMSSGTDICSWSYFLKNFIPTNITMEEFTNYLPCTIKDHKLSNCKFYDDVKFRNEGKETNNIPCPLVTLSFKDAKAKRDRDNNLIGNMFFSLTNDIINDGLTCLYIKNWWTSLLTIQAEKSLDPIESQITVFLSSIQDLFPEDGTDIYLNQFEELKGYKKFLDSTRVIDSKVIITCALKGYAIDWIRDLLDKNGYERYVIDFGGDIFIKNSNIDVHINEHFKIKCFRGNCYSIFTSGNTSKRGKHITNGPDHQYSVTMIKWIPGKKIDNTIVDILSTKYFAKEQNKVDKIYDSIHGIISHLRFSEENKLITKCYCASPFFNLKQIEIRDKMVSKIEYQFRPDLTESSIKYNEGKDDDSVEAVVKDNIYGIEGSLALVFPKHTDDLGTLYEVGHALAYGNPVIAYDDKTNQYEIHIKNKVNYGLEMGVSDNLLFDCSKKKDVIAMGFASIFMNPNQIYYELKGARDNIMLSVLYHHIEKVKGEYVDVKRDKSDRDE